MDIQLTFLTKSFSNITYLQLQRILAPHKMQIHHSLHFNRWSLPDNITVQVPGLPDKGPLSTPQRSKFTRPYRLPLFLEYTHCIKPHSVIVWDHLNGFITIEFFNQPSVGLLNLTRQIMYVTIY